MTATDPQDQPDGGGYGLVFPFIACQSNGGRYDDDAFVAGYQAGRVDHALAAAAAVGADRLTVMVYTDLVPQLDLIGMHHGFARMAARQVEASEDHEAMPEWCSVTLERIA